MREEFHPHETQLAQLVYSIENCAMKLCTETGLSSQCWAADKGGPDS